MRTLLFLLVVALGSSACDDQIQGVADVSGDVADSFSSDTFDEPLMTLHHAESAKSIGPAYSDLQGSPVPVMYGPQGPAAYLPFAAIVPDGAPIAHEHLDVNVHMVYLQTGKTVDIPYARQKLRPCKDNAYAQDFVYWGYVALLADAFDVSDIIDLEVTVTLIDEAGNSVSDHCPIRVKWYPSGSD